MLLHSLSALAILQLKVQVAHVLPEGMAEEGVIDIVSYERNDGPHGNDPHRPP